MRENRIEVKKIDTSENRDFVGPGDQRQDRQSNTLGKGGKGKAICRSGA